MTTCGALLTIAGGLAELGGLGLTVRDIGDARRQASGLGLDRTVVELSASVAGQSAAQATLSGGRELTVEERLAVVEKSLTAIDRQVDARSSALRDEIQNAVDDARQHARHQDRELRKFLHAMLTGSLARQRRGVALFAFGVILGVMGNLVG